MESNLKAGMAIKPFPWKCGHCQEKAVYRTATEYVLPCEYEGREYAVAVPDLLVPKCRSCGKILFDRAASERMTDLLREQLGLLKPLQIRDGRESLGFTQEELAANLRIAPTTISRWETGAQIQERALDLLMRLYFGLAEVRTAISNEGTARTLGEVAA